MLRNLLNEPKKVFSAVLFSLVFSLLIPVAGAQAQVLPSGVAPYVHTVSPGDTLWSISKQLLEDAKQWNVLQTNNKIKNPHLILPGSQIVVNKKLPPLGGGAEVLEVSGPVWFKRGSEPQVKVSVGMRVMAGDILATERGSFVSLALPDGSKVVLPSSSGIQVLDVSDRVIRIKLLEGRVESYVDKMRANSIRQFELQMRSANLGVRGTHFRGRMEGGLESAEVLSGVVAAEPVGGNAPGVMVNKGEGMALTGSATVWQKQTLLPAPQLASPAFGWLSAPTSTDAVRALQVQPLTGAKSYRVQLARDDAFLRIFWESRFDQQQVALPRQEGGFAYARVTAFDEKGLEGVPGDALVFLADNRETPGASLKPLGGGHYELRWPGYAGQSFSVSLGRDPAMSFKLVDEPAVFGSGLVLGPITVPGKYYWQVKALEPQVKDAANAGPQRVFAGEFEVEE